jgi:hypothetical protein
VTDEPCAASDELCRFVRRDAWNAIEGILTQAAFRASDRKLSVFSPERVSALGSSLRDLCFGSLRGAGEAILTAADYRELAGMTNPPTQLDDVYWRASAADVGPEHAPWSEAHAQVETTAGPDDFPRRYRLALANRARVVRIPEEQATP